MSCSCQSLAVGTAAAAVALTWQHGCHGSDKKYIGLAVLQDRITAPERVSILFCWRRGAIAETAVQCLRGNHNCIMPSFVKWCNSLLSQGNAFRKPDGCSWMWLSSAVQTVVLHTCRTVPFLNFCVLHRCARSFLPVALSLPGSAEGAVGTIRLQAAALCACFCWHCCSAQPRNLQILSLTSPFKAFVFHPPAL